MQLISAGRLTKSAPSKNKLSRHEISETFHTVLRIQKSYSRFESVPSTPSLKKFCRRACKPDSVPALSSRPQHSATIPLGDASLHRSSGLPGGAHCLLLADSEESPKPLPWRSRRAGASLPIWPCSVWGLPCHATHAARGALLPHLFTLTAIPLGPAAVCFLWHWPSPGLEARRPDVIRHTTLRSPDFPLPVF